MPKSMPTLASLFEQLRVPRDRVVYIHSSMDWMLNASMDVGEVTATLLSWFSEGGTLVMPSFPFVRGHEAYLRTRPHLDVRTTPTRSGLINEWVRRQPGARRSLDPDLPVSAIGPQADVIVGRQPTGPDPKGPDSPFHRILASGGALVGLGVTTNYMGMTHVVDARFRARYDFPIYSPETFEATVTDYDGVAHHVRKHAVPAILETDIRPSHLIELIPPGSDMFRAVTIGGTSFFRWSLPEWEELSTRHVTERLARGQVPCWHELTAPQLRGMSRG